jgi:hypothetical protein
MMNSVRRLATVVFLFASLAFTLPPQTPPPMPQASPAHTSPLGFSYGLPADWQVIEFPESPSVREMKQKTQPKATDGDEKRGLGCTQVALTGRRGDPPSTVIVVQLPFDCVGGAVTEADLPRIADGASAQLRQGLKYTDDRRGTYSLGQHHMWIERSKGPQKGYGKIPYITEITCTLLKKGAVCWMAVAADDASLQAFEQSAVTLEDGAPVALVPATAFDKKPK